MIHYSWNAYLNGCVDFKLNNKYWVKKTTYKIELMVWESSDFGFIHFKTIFLKYSIEFLLNIFLIF